MDNKGKEGSFKPIIIVMIFIFAIASFWNSFPVIKNSVHYILDPLIGPLLDWNIFYGLVLTTLIISFFATIIQKYTTDQKTLKELRKEQKILQEEMKKYKEHPEKLIALQKKQFEFLPKTMKLSMRALIFTGIPFILFFRWFGDYFTVIGNPDIFLSMGWFGTYFVFTILFSSILRKILKVV